MAVRNRRGKAKVLLDQQDGEPLLLEGADRPTDLLDDDRREPLGRLIEEEQPRARAQDAADREHLLLAAGQLGSGAAQALLEVREQCEDALEIERLRPHLGWQQEVFLDIEARKNTPFFRAEGYSEAGDPVAGETNQLPALVAHRSRSLADDPHDRFERRGLARPVATEQGHYFACPDLERDAVQDVGFAVPGLQPLDRQERRRFRIRHGRPRDRLRARWGWPRPFRSRLPPRCARA